MKPEELRARRIALGYRPVAFAAWLGVRYETIWKWETGKAPIPRILCLLLDCLEESGTYVDADYIST